MQPSSSLARATLLLTAVGLVSHGLAFFYRAALSRLVGAETLGLYQLIMPVYAVIQSVIMSGLAVALSSLSAGLLSKGSQKAVTQLLYTALKGLLLLWIPAACVVCLTSKLIAERVLGDLRTQAGLVLLLPVLLLTGVENLHKHHFYGIGETKLPAGIELAEQFIRTGAILGLLVWLLPMAESRAVAVIVVGMLVSEVFSSVTLVILRFRREGRLGSQLGRLQSPAAIRKMLLKVAIPVSGAALLNNLIGSANTILIPQKLTAFGLTESVAVEEFGVVFGMTLPMLAFPTAFVGALCTALLPRLTRCAALRQRERLRSYISGSLRGVSVLLFPLLALVVMLGRDIGWMVFRDQRVGRYLVPLAFEVALSAWESVLATVLNGIGKQSVSAGINLLCGGIQLGFTCFGMEAIGFPACFAGMILASMLGILLRLWVVYYEIGLEMDIFNIFTAPLLSSMAAGAWGMVVYKRLLGMGIALIPAMLLSAGCGIAVYFMAMWSLGALPPFPSFCRSSSHSSTQRKRMT